MNDEIVANIISHYPDLKIQVRGPLEPGLSGAEVLLVDFDHNGERRLGVLKITTSVKAHREADGDERARGTWLKPYLPDFFRLLDQQKCSNGSMGILMSLAKDRLENCETLHAALTRSFPYAKNYVIGSIAGAYRDEAAKCWQTARFESVRESFVKSASHELPNEWEARWRENGLPPVSCAAFVYEDLPERWPNPVAYLNRPDLWPKDEKFGISVPWISSHGDLNCRNVLCPSADRSLALSMATGAEHELLKFGQLMLSHVSMIDMPFCREAPFTFDPAFLAVWFGFLLPRFDTRAQRDVVLKAFSAALKQLRTENEQIDVPADATKFVECFQVISSKLLAAQPRMADDIKRSLFCSLAASSLWLALRVGSSDGLTDDNRLNTVRLLCFSAKALGELLGEDLSLGRAGDDFSLEGVLGRPKRKAWTKAASQLGALFPTSKGRRNILLVLGREWNETWRLPADNQLERIASMSREEIIQITDHEMVAESVQPFQALARLPLAAVFDWSALPAPRRTVAAVLPPPHYVRPVVPGETEPAWGEQDALFWIHLRGSLEVVPSLAIKGPARNQARAKLRNPLAHFRNHRSGDFTILYVGISPEDLKETHAFLQEFWGDKPQSYYIGPSGSSELRDFLEEWSIKAVEGNISDFLTAAEDVPPSDVLPGSPLPRRVIRVADMGRSDDGNLIAKTGETLEIKLEVEDIEAVCRAGHLLTELDHSTLTILTRDPKEFFVGHPIEFSEIHAGLAIDRKAFHDYLKRIKDELAERHLQSVFITSRPGAGASTAIRWLAYQLAFKEHVPTLVLKSGGACAFEAVERVHRLVGRSFVVVADPQDVPSDELNILKSRCAPARYPVVFVSSLRAFRSTATRPIPVLEIELNDGERVEFLQRLARHCPSVPLARLMRSQTRSLFLLTLEAFGDANVRVDRYASELLSEATREQALLLAIISLFSRYAHRGCSLEFLQIATDRSIRGIEEDLEPFDQLLVLNERDSWICRHDQLSKAVLQFHLTHAFDDRYRYELAGFFCGLLKSIAESGAGTEIAADYIWAILNPQVEPEPTVTGERPQQSRFIGGEDGLPTSASRHQVFLRASETFSAHLNIIAHFGKYLSEEEKKFAEADVYLLRANELDPKNEAIPHMLGKRFFDEVRELLDRNPPHLRADTVQECINTLANQASDWFSKARALNLSSEFGYTTAIQLNIRLIRDEFQRIGVRSVAENASALESDRVIELLAESDSLVSDGQRYIEPREENRRVFNQAKDKLHQLRGDLNTAISCFEQHVRSQRGLSQALAKVQLARLLHERGELNMGRGERGRASKDFTEGERQIFTVLQDPALKFKNIKLWFECARHLPNLTRADLTERLHQLHDNDPASLDASFLLMCHYFCEALETMSPESWRRYEEFQRKSSARSANIAIRRYVREWLVKQTVAAGGKNRDEYRILPHHYYDPAKARESGRSRGHEIHRVRIVGVVARVESSTEGYLEIQPMRFQVFFRPRAGDRPFYKSDSERRTLVTFMVAFTYEKPEAFEVERA